MFRYCACEKTMWNFLLEYRENFLCLTKTIYTTEIFNYSLFNIHYSWIM